MPKPTLQQLYDWSNGLDTTRAILSDQGESDALAIIRELHEWIKEEILAILAAHG